MILLDIEVSIRAHACKLRRKHAKLCSVGKVVAYGCRVVARYIKLLGALLLGLK